MISTGVIGIASRLSMVPRSISRVTDSAVKISMVMVRMVPTSPGTMLSWVTPSRVVARMGADFERHDGSAGTSRSCDSAVCQHLVERAERGTRGHRIGGVGRDQHRRLVAAAHHPLEIGRDLDGEQHLARGEQFVEFGLGLRQLRDPEIVGVAQRRQIERPRSLCSCSSTAVGRCRGLVLMA